MEDAIIDKILFYKLYKEKTVLELNEPNRYLAVIFIVYAIKDGLLNWWEWKDISWVEQKQDHIWKWKKLLVKYHRAVAIYLIILS